MSHLKVTQLASRTCFLVFPDHCYRSILDWFTLSFKILVTSLCNFPWSIIAYAGTGKAASPVFLICVFAVHLPTLPSYVSALLLSTSHSKVIFLLDLLNFARSSGAQFTPYLFCETEGASVTFKIVQLECRSLPFLLGNQGVKKKFHQAYFCICK